MIISKRTRHIFFVCSAIVDNELVSIKMETRYAGQACEDFVKQFGIEPKTIFGPFNEVKRQIATENTKTLKFATNRPRKAIYMDWEVNVFDLIEPEKQAYLIFVKRIDDKRLPSPKGIITVPMEDLRFIND